MMIVKNASCVEKNKGKMRRALVLFSVRACRILRLHNFLNICCGFVQNKHMSNDDESKIHIHSELANACMTRYLLACIVELVNFTARQKQSKEITDWSLWPFCDALAVDDCHFSKELRIVHRTLCGNPNSQ